jgi:hypothetical protein
MEEGQVKSFQLMHSRLADRGIFSGPKDTPGPCRSTPGLAAHPPGISWDLVCCVVVVVAVIRYVCVCLCIVCARASLCNGCRANCLELNSGDRPDNKVHGRCGAGWPKQWDRSQCYECMDVPTLLHGVLYPGMYLTEVAGFQVALPTLVQLLGRWGLLAAPLRLVAAVRAQMSGTLPDLTLPCLTSESDASTGTNI